MAYSKDRGDAPMRRRGGRRRKKVCIFCADKNAVIDYKDVNKLKRYGFTYITLDLEGYRTGSMNEVLV